MPMTTTIPCPDCGTQIPYEAAQLLQGGAFECPNVQCAASIEMAPNSRNQWVSGAQAFAQLKGLDVRDKEDRT